MYVQEEFWNEDIQPGLRMSFRSWSVPDAVRHGIEIPLSQPGAQRLDIERQYQRTVFPQHMRHGRFAAAGGAVDPPKFRSHGVPAFPDNTRIG